MTVLREPAEWYFSLFQHRRELEGKVPHEAHPDAIFRRAAGLDITEVEFDVYLDNTYWMWNIFTRSLAGDIDHDTSSAAASFLEPRNSPSKDHVIDALVEGIERRQTDISDEALAKNTRLDAAVRRLKSFTYFALFDRVKESLALFDFTFCVDTSRHRAFKNVKFKLELTAQQKHDRPQRKLFT